MIDDEGAIACVGSGVVGGIIICVGVGVDDPHDKSNTHINKYANTWYVRIDPPHDLGMP
jgi:hypothetical protein